MDKQPLNYTPYPDSLHDHTFGDTVSHLRIPLLVGALTILVILLMGVYYFSRMPKKEPVNQVLPTVPILPTTAVLPTDILSPTSEATASADLPPLYPGVEWGEPTAEEIRFFNKDFEPVDVNGYSLISKPLDTYPTAFIQYYINELSKQNWEQISYAGDTTTGEFYLFLKSGHYIRFGVRKFQGDQAGRAMLQYN